MSGSRTLRAPRSRLAFDHRSAGPSVALVLTLVFVTRWLLSDHQSYWLDELLSVATYGIERSSVSDMIGRLARQSIHPPLYQVILFNWMKLAGDGEAATRALSNVFVTGAAYCLYRTARPLLGPRRAAMAVVFFSLMSVPTAYALETRSYGFSLFLSTLSSWMLFGFIRVLASDGGWKQVFFSRICLALMLVKFGLLMTHYYNAFFLASQGVFVLAWTALRRLRRGGFRVGLFIGELLKAALPLLLPLVVQLAVWGPVMARSYRKHSAQFVVGDAPLGMFEGCYEYAVLPNFPFVHHAVLLAIGLPLVACYAAMARTALLSRASARLGKSTLAGYMLVIALGPFAVAYVLFVAAGHERYYDRYFSFVAPALAVMLVLAIEQIILLADRVVGRLRLKHWYLRGSVPVTLAALALILPGTYEATTRFKADWRGTASTIADLVDGDPQHKYLVYATGFTTYPSLDYYFERMGKKTRVRGLVRLSSDGRAQPLDADRKKIERADYLVLAFTHLAASRFPQTLSKLAARYPIQASLMHDDRGVIVYGVSKAKRASASAQAR